MRAKTVRPLAFTAASRRSIVSFGPWLLFIVVNPPAAIACIPHEMSLRLVRKLYCLVRKPASIQPARPLSSCLAVHVNDPHQRVESQQRSALMQIKKGQACAFGCLEVIIEEEHHKLEFAKLVNAFCS